MADSNSAVIKHFSDEATAAHFGRNFVERFITPAFGVLPKGEIELVVFELLVEAKALDPNGPIYPIARALNITPAKAKGLVFKYQLRHVTAEDTDQAVFKTLVGARFFKDGTNLAFGVESPLVRSAIAAKMKERGVFSDVSISGDILKVSPAQFAEILVSLLPEKVAKEIAAKVKKQGFNENEVKKALRTVAKKAAEDFVVDQAKEELGALLDTAGKAAVEHGPDVIEKLAELVTHLADLL